MRAQIGKGSARAGRSGRRGTRRGRGRKRRDVQEAPRPPKGANKLKPTLYITAVPPLGPEPAS